MVTAALTAVRLAACALLDDAPGLRPFAVQRAGA